MQLRWLVSLNDMDWATVVRFRVSTAQGSDALSILRDVPLELRHPRSGRGLIDICSNAHGYPSNLIDFPNGISRPVVTVRCGHGASV